MTLTPAAVRGVQRQSKVKRQVLVYHTVRLPFLAGWESLVLGFEFTAG